MQSATLLEVLMRDDGRALEFDCVSLGDISLLILTMMGRGSDPSSVADG